MLTYFKSMNKIAFIIASILFASCNKDGVFRQYEKATTPVKLGEGSLSTDSVQWNNVFVAKTNELYFTKMGKSASIIYKFDFNKEAFENLEEIPLPIESPNSDVYVNPKGNLMLFSSLMPEYEQDTISDWNIWKSIRKNGEWQTPKPFFSENLEGNQFYPWLTNSGNLYFAITPHGSQNSDLYVSKYSEGRYEEPIPLPKRINSDKLEGDAYVSPDESFLIFAGFEREQNLGKSDLFISFNENGDWSEPLWLGEEINSEGYDGSPFVTEDEKFLIFTSSRGSTDDNVFFNHYIVRFNKGKWESKST